ncbi:MAG: pseudouridine synthase [Polyangiales bacterium]
MSGHGAETRALAFTITGAEHDRALDAVVRAQLGGSWGEARKLIERGKVFIDGVACRDERVHVRRGASIEIRPTARRVDGIALDDAAIAFVDAHVVVVRKPAGISTIPYEPGERGTLQERTHGWLVRRARHAPNASLGVVHRIDKPTSGLVVFARTLAAKRVLANAFRAHTIERRYVAIVHGVVERAVSIETSLVEDRGDGIRGSAKDAGTAAHGQRAITHISPIEILSRDAALDGASVVGCRLETGRTHQIRIHLSERRSPLVGDTVYTRDRLRAERPLIEAPRLMLHAMVLGFEHPITGEALRFVEPVPADMIAVASRLAGRAIDLERLAAT